MSTVSVIDTLEQFCREHGFLYHAHGSGQWGRHRYWTYYKVKQGNTLHFKTGNRYATSCTGKVLANPKTGEEICFVEYRGSRIMLEASHYMHGGRRVTREEMNTLYTDDGRTLAQFLADEAAKPLEERL